MLANFLRLRKMTRAEWSAMSLYEKFEDAVVIVLSGIIAIVVIAAVWSLMREVVTSLVLGALDPLDFSTFQAVFGMIFTVVIALEFKRSLLVAADRGFGILQVRTIILIALLAIVRKFIILDLADTSAAKVAALSGAVLALGAVFWLVRDQDRQERHEQIQE